MKRIAGLCFTVFCTAAGAAQAADALAAMKFNDVREVAPGVFFRYSAISPTDPSIFAGCNNIWVVFEDYVVVIDANFPKEARDVLAAVRKTTDKPIRYVFDTHHHGDHAYGNAVWAGQGASVMAQTKCVQWLRVKGPKEFEEAGQGKNGRKDVAESKLKVPDIAFDDKLVLDDGKQRIEFMFLGHAHTPGDGFAYLARHKILCTGDACVNGAFNYMGHSDSASWIKVLERAQQLDVKLICPGHGPVAGKQLLEKQKRYFVELRQQVRKGIDADKDLKDIQQALHMPWYKEWTTVEPSRNEENVQHVYAELTGQTMPWELTEDYGLYEGPSPTKDTPGWSRPRRIVVPNLMPAKIKELKRVAPGVLFMSAKTQEDAAKLAEDADAVVGFCTPAIVRAGQKLRWVQLVRSNALPERLPELTRGQTTVTQTERVHGPAVADEAFALLLCLTHDLKNAVPGYGADKPPAKPPRELRGKTLLVIGLGGAGTQIARRAHAFGMRVSAVDPRVSTRPEFVFSLDKLEALPKLLPQADAVVLACRLSGATRELLGPGQFSLMKKTAYVINVGRPELIKRAALVEALKKGRLAGAGLVEAGFTPLELAYVHNAVVAPARIPQTPEVEEREWQLVRENVRRFAAGERLLGVVDDK
jgi:phosphoglycerate dehydrogenase-like enzyme/glyoxylase-like metal-dependent hydrolase (beta-lactamase superfamily II)